MDPHCSPSIVTMDGASDLVAEMEQVSISEMDLPSSPQVASPLASESKVDEVGLFCKS